MDKAQVRAIQLRIMEVLSYGITFGFFAVLALMFYKDIPQAGHDSILVMFGSLTASMAAIVGYFFGSSASSANKDAQRQPKPEETK